MKDVFSVEKRDFIGIPVSFRLWVEKHIPRPTRNKNIKDDNDDNDNDFDDDDNDDVDNNNKEI